MANQPQYVGTPKVGIATITFSNSNTDGTGIVNTVFTSGSSGSRIDAINIKAVGNTSPGMVRLYINNGNTSTLMTEVQVVGISTSGNTIPSFETQLNTNSMSQVLPIILQTGHSLRASTQVANTFNIIAVGGDF
jgi:hypothetical protein